MTSFLNRSSQNFQSSPLRRSEANGDVFSELRSFRQESQKKALQSRKLGQTLQQLESPKSTLKHSSTAASSQWRTGSLIQSIGKATSPLKKSSIQVQQYSPSRSYLQKTSEAQLNQSSSFANNLDSLQRDIKDISFSYQFQNQINSLGSSLPIRRALSPKKSPSLSQVQTLQNVISYSPSHASQKLFSPNRLLNRLNSTQFAQFSDFEFPATNQVEGRRLQRSASSVTKSQQRKEDLSDLLNGTRSQIYKNNIANLSESSNKKQSNLSQSVLSLASKNNNVDLLRNSQIPSIVENRAADLENLLANYNHTEFNQLPKHTIERLISLSSTVMSKIKNSSFYKGHYF